MDTEELELDELVSVLREINDRQWAAYRQVLVEAKFKAEAMLRNDQVYEYPGKVAHYNGWVAYSDFVISNLESLRSKQFEPEAELHPGPE